MALISRLKATTFFESSISLCRLYFQLLFMIVFWLSSFSTFAQWKEIENNLFIISRPTTDSIMLRWAPSNYKYWDLGNNYGYKLLRHTIMKDGAFLPERLETSLTPEGLKVWPLEHWENLVKTNKYGGIAAQAIYGDSFELDSIGGITPKKVVDKKRAQNQRFSFALFAADISPDVAKASGLWFADKTAKKNEMYLYTLSLNLPDSLSNLNDTTFVYTGFDDYAPLPVPIELSAKFADKMVDIKWNSFAQDNIYIAWELERSDNGLDFKPINSDPLATTSGVGRKEYSYVVDSLPQNNKEYFYKIRGISSFGERGPWSKLVSGNGIESIKGTPNISKHNLINNGVIINWVFPVEAERAISGFKVLRSRNDKTNFVELKAKLKPSTRSFFDKNPLLGNYYKVVAYRDSTAQKTSFPYFVQLNDSIPPVKPTGLVGKVDSMGIVMLNWIPNPDEDIYGYRVFRSVSNNEEYTQITSRPIPNTFFQDIISKKDLNRSVFYKILANDLRQNHSQFSDILELIKPDYIPPSNPVITNAQILEEGIRLTWINSTSQDVDRHEILRYQQGDSAWIKISELPNNNGSSESEFIDMNCSKVKTNQYKVVAIDKTGNISEPSLSIALIGRTKMKNEGVKKVHKYVDIEKGTIQLSWKLPERPVSLIKIYRKTKVMAYSLFETLEGKSTSFEDYGMNVGNIYAYRIKLIFEDGSVSGFSEEINIEL